MTTLTIDELKKLTSLTADVSRYAVHMTPDDVARDVAKLQKLSKSLYKGFRQIDPPTNEDKLMDRAAQLARALKIKIAFNYDPNRPAIVLNFAGLERWV